MANVNNSGVLRQERIKTEVEGQDTRLSGDRGKHLSRGSFINYYDDLGFTTTSQGAREFKDYQKNLAQQVGVANEGIKKYETDYNKAAGMLEQTKKQYGSFEKLVSSSWDQTQNKFTTIKVVDPNNKVEGTYKLPKEAAEELMKEKMLYTNYIPEENTFYIATKSKGKGPVGGKYIGKELHESFYKAEKELYNKWYEQSQPVLMKTWNTLKGQVEQAEGQLGTAKANISTAKTDVKAATEQNALNWQKLKDDFQRKKTEMGKVLASMNFEEA